VKANGPSVESIPIDNSAALNKSHHQALVQESAENLENFVFEELDTYHQ